jgi:hypothetical protein
MIACCNYKAADYRKANGRQKVADYACSTMNFAFLVSRSVRSTALASPTVPPIASLNFSIRNLENKFHFHRGIKRQRVGPHRRPRMAALIPEHLLQKLARPVGHFRLVVK